MTVGEKVDSNLESDELPHGYVASSYGSLADDAFTHGTVDYTVRIVGVSTGTVEFTTNETTVFSNKDNLVLEIAGEELNFSDIWYEQSISTYSYFWETTALPTTHGFYYDPNLSSHAFHDTLPKDAMVTVCLRTSTQVCGGSPPTLSTDATLSALALQDASDNSAITLSPGFSSSTTSYTASEANDVDEITVLPTVNESNATYEIQDGDGTALVDANSQTGFQVALSEGENTVKVEVTAQDTTTTETYTVVVTRLRRVTTTPAAPPEVTVPNDWSLIPSGLVAGSKFRLIFLSSTKTNATSYDIADYNTFIQGLAAAGHTDIRTYSSGFRAVGCTADSDARDNTATTGTGVRIHWLNGNKVADDYGDFKDGDWDDEANDKNELGANGPNTSLAANYPFTGCAHNGTESLSSGTSRALGAPGGDARVGIPNDSGSGHGPLSSSNLGTIGNAFTRPMYGLSQVFEVAAAGNTSASGKPAITGTAQVGQTLTASKGTIADAEGTTKADAGDTGYAYTYQWVQVDGSTETAIPSETGTTYTPVAADVGKTIKVQASFKDDEDNAEGPLTSDATAAVVAAAPCDALWCATMTVGTSSGLGLEGYSETGPDIGTLTPRTFTYDDATVRVDAIYYDDDYDELAIQYLGNLGGSDYTLQLGELSLPLADPGSSLGGAFDISTSDIDWTDGETVTVKLFEGLGGATLSDDATLSALPFGFLNHNPDDPSDASDESEMDEFLDPPFHADTTYYTVVIPARVDTLVNDSDGAVPTVAEATVEFTVNNRVIGNADEEIPLKTGTNYLRFEVTAPDGEATKTYTVKVTRLPGLKASFAVPGSHDGSTPFTVTVQFNEDISSALSNVAAAVVVTDGTKGAVTADGSSMRRFLILVTPDSSKPVRIRVRGANHCTQSRAVCAVSGKLLSTEFSRWVGAEDDATLRALWLTTKSGSWIQRRPVFRPDTTSYHAGVANGVEEMTLQASPYAKGVTVAVSGPAGTFTTTERYDGGATAKLDVPTGETTWTVTVTSEDGNETTSYEMTVDRGGAGTTTVPADVRLKTLTVTPVDGTLLSFSPSFHLDTEAATFRVRVSSDTTAVTVSVEKNSVDPDVNLMRTETNRLDSLDEDPDLAGIQFELTMDRKDLGGARENRYKSIWVIGPNAGVEGHTAFNRRVYQLWITKAAEGVGLATAAEPLMAAFENVPLSHDGSSAFTFRMAFSEEVEITPEDMRDHAFVVSGATVTGAERVDGLKSLWELTLEPSGSGPVSILTPLNRACTEAGALCTAEGRSLTVAPALQVAGPVPAAPALTASLESVPQAHDGSTAFTFRMAFSADVEITPEDMRDHALTVSGGTVTAAAMVDGRKDLWELTVEPAGSGPVSILTPLERACTEAGALCTADGRSLTGGLGVQVPGPPPAPALTASFASVPQAHDGTSAFTVRLAFSAPIRNSYKHLRDEALSVTGGTVARARRVDGRSDLWELTVEPGGHGAVTVELAAAASCEDTGALCTADGRALSNAIATTVAGPPPLTAAFVSVPAEHDGETEFWLELSFNAAVAQGSKRHIRALLGVTGGSETKIRRKDGRLDHWRVRVEPSSHEAVTVTLSPSPACGATGAVCTEDGRTFTTALATQIQGPPGLTVADAEVQEAANATLAFAVTLGRAPSGTVTVDYATSDGTATAGSDYTAASGTLTFAAGETEKTVSVPVLDDAHDEGSETLTLTLSNASGAYHRRRHGDGDHQQLRPDARGMDGAVRAHRRKPGDGCVDAAP